MLKGKHIQLRALERQDMPVLLRWMNDPALTVWLGPRAPITLDDQYKWFEKLSADKSKLKLMILDESGKEVGLVSLMDINFKDQTAEFGIYLGEHSALGKGLGKDASLTMMKYAFEELGLKRLFLVVLEENTRAIKSFKDCGFQSETVLRESMYSEGRYQNQVIMGILSEEFHTLGGRIEN